MNFTPEITAGGLETLDVYKFHKIAENLSKINRNLIEDELESFPAVYSYYYGLLVRSSRLLSDAVNELDRYKADFKTTIRKNEGKKTVDALNDLVNGSDLASELNTKIALFEEIYGYMKGLVETLNHKKDMLVQLSANKRQEIKLHS